MKFLKYLFTAWKFIGGIYHLINSFTGSWWSNRRNHGQTIHPGENLNSMNLLQMSCVITREWSFLTSELCRLLEAKNTISQRTLWYNVWFIPPRQFCLPKIHQEMRSDLNFSLHSASISRILKPSPQGLISSVLYTLRLQPFMISQGISWKIEACTT